MVDEILELIKTISPDFELKYNKYYIGLANKTQINNFVIFRPQKNDIMRFELRIPKADEIEEKIEAAGLDILDYDTKWSRYRIKLNKSQMSKNKDTILELLNIAYKKSM